MAGWPGPTLARVAARLVALALLLVGLLPILRVSVRPVLAAGCAGDEQILLVPTKPTVGSPMIVAATSRAAHEQVLLLGPDGPMTVERQPAGERYVWQATVTPERAGEHLFAFGVAADAALLTTCADARALVTEAVDTGAPLAGPDAVTGGPEVPLLGETSPLVALLNPYGRSAAAANGQDAGPDVQAAPASAPTDGGAGVTAAANAEMPTPTRTLRPTRTPSRHAETANGNENDNDAEPTPTRTPTVTRTPVPVKTPSPTHTPRPDPTNTPRPDSTDTPVPLATEAVPPTATRTPRPDPTDTPVPDPTATRTPRPDPTETPTRVPTATRTPRPDPTDTPVPTPTPTMEPPAITDWSPASAFCGQRLTIRGQRFGSNRDAVNGRVTIDGRDTEVFSWSMTQIEVKVPLTVQPGKDREIVIAVAGRTVSAHALFITC